MNREEVARRFRWSWIFGILGVANPAVGIPQLWSLATTGKHEGLSLITFVMMFVIVVAFAIDGFFGRRKVAMWSMGASALVNGANLALIVYLRYIR